MARVKRGVIARARHKKILKQAKGYYGARSRVYRVAFQAVIKAGTYAPSGMGRQSSIIIAVTNKELMTQISGRQETWIWF